MTLNNLQNWGLVCWKATSGEKSGVLCRSSSSLLLPTHGALECKSRQQLDRCLAATVFAARHHSNMHHSFFSPLAAWKPHHCARAWRHRLNPIRRNIFIRNHAVRDVNELKQHLIETWSATSRASLIKRLISGIKIVLMQVSKPKANTVTFAIIFLRNCHDF